MDAKALSMDRPAQPLGSFATQPYSFVLSGALARHGFRSSSRFSLRICTDRCGVIGTNMWVAPARQPNAHEGAGSKRALPSSPEELRPERVVDLLRGPGAS
jgi:hypothetical protein